MKNHPLFIPSPIVILFTIIHQKKKKIMYNHQPTGSIIMYHQPLECNPLYNPPKNNHLLLVQRTDIS